MLNDKNAKYDISIVIPAKNEEGRLPKTLELLGHHIGALEISSELIVVNDGSKDQTAHLAESSGAHVINYTCGKGIAAAFRSGAKFSHGEIVMLCPADIYDFCFLRDALQASLSFDVVSISKRHPKSEVIGYSKWRWFLSNSYQWCVNLLFGRSEMCTDTHYVKLYHRTKLRDIIDRCRLNGPTGETELMLYARDAGCSFAEVPAKIIHRDTGSKTSLTLILRTIIELVSLWVQRKLH